MSPSSPSPGAPAEESAETAAPATGEWPARGHRKPADPVAAAARRLGIERLHDEQVQVIEDVLAGRDVLMILPTGFGKSACYQVPSMVLRKPVVMISPLIALLRDQHRVLLERDIDCVRIDGSVRGRARKEALDRIERGGPLLVMTTPETLAVADVSEVLKKTGVGLAAVDEAHCISEWGHDFRPAYRRLGSRLRAFGGPPILALTATATERIRSTIVTSLGMREPSVVASSPHRSNLAFEVLHCEGDERLRALVRLVKRLRRPGIIYCATRREVDTVYAVLRRFGVPTHRYHGAMNAGDRHAEQKRFMRSRHRSVMTATNAFGLGIDKPDIRYILHYQAPASLEQYVQEAGRGGRDGKKANCILLDDPSDRAIHEALLSRSRVRPDQLYQLGAALAAWSEEDRDPSLEALALSAELGPRVTSALLTKVEEAGLVEAHDHEVRILTSHETIEEDVRALAGQFETLKIQDGRRLDSITAYERTDLCRAVFLRDYFGEEGGLPCGLCDVCRGRPDRPTGFFDPLVRPASKKKKKKRSRGKRSSDESAGGRRGRGRRRGRKKVAAQKSAADGSASAESAQTPGRRRRRRRRRRKPSPEPG
ncbi:MAG: RecQ family ATP-dependent DNA helicase [Myxococcota bacterium]